MQQAVNKRDANLTAKSDIHIANFDLMYGEKKLLTDASLTINYGHRYRTIGRLFGSYFLFGSYLLFGSYRDSSAGILSALLRLLAL